MSSESPRSLAEGEKLDLTSFSTSLLFSSIMGLTVRALLYAPDRLWSFAARAEGNRAVGRDSGLSTGDEAGRRTGGDVIGAPPEDADDEGRDDGGREDEACSMG